MQHICALKDDIVS